MTERLRTEGLTRRFGALTALDQVDFEATAGEIHAILGENGAGKTTFMEILFGLLPPDAGTIHWNGAPVTIASPADALALGIGMVHQHFMLVSALTVWENLWLSHPARPRFHLDRHLARRAVDELSERFGLELDPDALVRDLPVGARQRIEIAKALSRPVELLILDEPTAVLTPGEVDPLFDVLRRLRDEGTTVLFISHKLPEVLRVSDRVTVLQRGRVTARCRTEDADVPSLTRTIIGDGATAWSRTPVRHVPRLSGPEPAGKRPDDWIPGGRRLKVRGLSSVLPGKVAIRNVSFDVRAGEIVGVTGVDGNGQDELVALLAGIQRADAGQVEIAGRDATGMSVRERWRCGLAVLPGDRARNGLVGSAPVWENLALREFGARWARRGGLVSPKAHRERAADRIRAHDVRGATPDTPAGRLSGGNQQKLLLARELAGNAPVIVLLNPTRGLDVGAADSLFRELLRLREEGGAVLLVSTELDEVLKVADRVAVLVGGTLREVPDADRERVGAAMLGSVPA